MFHQLGVPRNTFNPAMNDMLRHFESCYTTRGRANSIETLQTCHLKRWCKRASVRALTSYTDSTRVSVVRIGLECSVAPCNMKRKAAEASLHWDLQNYIIRFDVVISDPVYTNGQTQFFHLQLSLRDTIDNAKYLLSRQVWERNGRYLQPSKYQLEQLGVHLGFTQSV